MLEEHENGEKRVNLGDVAAAFGKGIFAGVAGTAVMTISSTKVLGVQPMDEESEARFSNLVHWGYGIAWGGVRGLLGVAGLSGPAATAAHFGAVWGTEQVMLPALKVTPPLTEWGVQEVAIDALHHLVYAGATGIAYSLLDR